MLTLNECRKIVSNDLEKYSDEELIELRNWASTMADIALAIVEKNGIKAISEIIDRENQQTKD